MGSRKPQLVLFVATLLWASTFVVTKEVIESAPILPFLCARFGLASLLICLYARRDLVGRPGLWRDGAYLGLLNATGLLLQALGQHYTTASKSSFITSLNTPLTPLIGAALYRMPISRAQATGVLLATVGLVLLTAPTGGAAVNAGDLLTLGCAAIYALMIVETSRLAPRHPSLGLSAVQILAGALVFMVAFAALSLLPRFAPAAAAWPPVAHQLRPYVVGPRLAVQTVYMAVVCTIFTFALQTWAMARMSATQAALIFALEPVLASTLALAVFGASEQLGGRAAVGGALVLLAILAEQVRGPRAGRSDAIS